MKKCNLLLIVLALLFSGINLVSINAEVNVVENVEVLETEMTEEKVYSSYSLNDEFSDDKVVVVIFHEYSELDKEFYKEDFPGVDIKEIKYLTPLIDPNQEYPCLNVDEYNQILELKLKNPGKENVLEAIEILEENPIVLSAEVVLPDIIIEDFGEETEILSTSINLYNETENVTAASITPNDTYFIQQYSLDLIQAEDAWGLTTGASTIKVGVIDTGVYNHPDLSANLLTGWDFVNNNGVTTDDIGGHGTSVAGLIAAVGNNSEGIAGVAWNVKIVPLQAGTPEGMISRTAAKNAIAYAAINNIPIINLSFGSIDNTNSYYEAINNYDGLVCCAAGNDGANTDDTPFYPACDDSDNVISVANSTSTNSLRYTSNYGKETVDLAAPGTNLKILYGEEGYGTSSGTSLASPLVAGVAALLKSYNPNLTAEEIKYAILNNVDKISALSGKVSSGGRLNAYKALTSVFAGNRAKVYKTRISIPAKTDDIKYAYIKQSYDKHKCQYYEYIIGDIIFNESSTTFQLSKEGYNEFYFVDGTLPIRSSGTLLDVKYKSRFHSIDCLLAISASAFDFLDVKGNYPAMQTSYREVLVGDVNFDDVINATDSNLVLSYASASSTLSDEAQIAGDVNDDNVLTAQDALMILQYAARTLDSF